MIEHIKPYLTRNETRAVNKYLNSGRYLTESIYTEELEHELAKFLGVKYVSMVPNGTSALYLSLLAAGVGSGDKVFVPDFTMIATANAVRMTGAEPILVDVDFTTTCLDLEKVKGKAKALIYVEFNGRSGNMKEVQKFCKKNDLILIEDSCQALGSEWGGKKLGSFGRFAAFSLGFHKIITTGQGGFVVSNTKADYETIERLKDFGRLQGGSDIHDSLGFNFKFTDLQAVIGLEQLKNIEWRMSKKQQLYKWYFDVEVDEEYVPWFIEIALAGRDKIYSNLKNHGIGSRKAYPPIHTQKIYKQEGDFNNTIHFSNILLWLPSSLSLTKKQVNVVKKHAYF